MRYSGGLAKARELAVAPGYAVPLSRRYGQLVAATSAVVLGCRLILASVDSRDGSAGIGPRVDEEQAGLAGSAKGDAWWAGRRVCGPDLRLANMLVPFEEVPLRLTRHHGVTFGLTRLGLVSSCSVRVRPTHC